MGRERGRDGRRDEGGRGRKDLTVSEYGRDGEGQRSGWESGRGRDRSRDRGKKREVGIRWEGLRREKSEWESREVGMGVRDGGRSKRRKCWDHAGKGEVGMGRGRSGWELGKGGGEVGMSKYGQDREGQRLGWESGRGRDRSRGRGKKLEVGIRWEGLRREKLGWESWEGLRRETSGWESREVAMGVRDGRRSKQRKEKGERSGWRGRKDLTGRGEEEVGMSEYGRDGEGQRSGWESGRARDQSRDRGKKREVGIGANKGREGRRSRDGSRERLRGKGGGEVGISEYARAEVGMGVEKREGSKSGYGKEARGRDWEGKWSRSEPTWESRGGRDASQDTGKEGEFGTERGSGRDRSRKGEGRRNIVGMGRGRGRNGSREEREALQLLQAQDSSGHST
ncbi:hypothetical protein CBR_g28813 [Chara braunii]|uniref:Uncharacterized protein n=1 Tax=Chara braunii TaxID=69332 RepID=A0A388L9Y0_CHABU|nr:hypothetical protein CBR_g28813 [Chara braunii]|eukprot:GBG79098.1 hypothetical protein CBR_g28813 [Chara braunii]